MPKCVKCRYQDAVNGILCHDCLYSRSIPNLSKESTLSITFLTVDGFERYTAMDGHHPAVLRFRHPHSGFEVMMNIEDRLIPLGQSKFWCRGSNSQHVDLWNPADLAREHETFLNLKIMSHEQNRAPEN